MSDQRIGSSPLSSPGRNPSALSRPEWPWSSGSSSLLRYSHRSSQSSLPPLGVESSTPPSASPGPSISSSHTWQTNPPLKHNTGSTMTIDDSTKQWSFIGFEWVVRNVHKLRDFVEGIEDGLSGTGESNPGEGADLFEVLKQSPVLGDHKFKLEIACSPPSSDGPQTGEPKPQSLSLYITSLTLEFAHHDYEMSASMMAAIKCQDDRVGERGARPDWVWEHWQNDFVFRQESEVWGISLPPLSDLLENPRIRETDSFTICVQVHSPIGPVFPSIPSAYYVPRDLLDGLEASLDNANTGDVRFVCLEKWNPDERTSPTISASEVTTPTTHRSSSSTSSYSPFSSRKTVRKRIIYAHSDILTRRSDYFATMLASSFSENTGLVSGDRKLYTIIVEDADFETIYWVLKYCYANWILFKEHDDPRAAVDGVGTGWSARWLNADGDEWGWKTFQKGGHGEDRTASVLDGKSVASGDSERSDSSKNKSKGLQPCPPSGSSSMKTTTAPRAPLSTTKSSSGSASSSRQSSIPVTPTTSRRVASSPGGTMPVPIVGPSSVRSKQIPIPLAMPPTNYPSSSHFPISPRTQRQRQPSTMATPDPHVHPTPTPAPASALSMYQVAHRYAMPGLSNLALEHMMSSITPHSSFALLLAVSAWDDLKALVEDYIVDKWDEVSVSEEFEQCCQEVAAGEWGAEGGKTLTTLFRRLRSPNAMGFARH